MRLYGEFVGEASLARVSLGFASVFPEAHRYNLLAWKNDLDDAIPEPPGAADRVGLFLGSLALLPVAFRAAHEEVWVMVAPNSNKIGKILKKKLAPVSKILAPSRWATEVLRAELPDKDVRHVPHGISSAFRAPDFPPTALPPGAGGPPGFRVLHLSSSTLERKGTDILIRAWAQAKLPGNLFLSVPRGCSLAFQELALACGVKESVKITDRLDYDAAGMSLLYATMHLVAQPSRGEGFGFVPLEARCCGTPVLMTDCTGHSEHAGGPGCVVVPSGPDAPIDDFPGARAPSVSVEAVAEGLLRAYSEREKLSEEARSFAPSLREKWSWENQLKEFKNGLLGSVHR